MSSQIISESIQGSDAFVLDGIFKCAQELGVKKLWNTSDIFHLLITGVFVNPNLYPMAGPFEWKVADSLSFVCIKHNFIG